MLSACSTPVSRMSGQSLHCCRSFTLSISGGTEKWRCFGKRNLIFMSIMLGALIAFPPIWREVAIGRCAIMSYYWTPARIHEANAFTFAPINAVACLFLCIFAIIILILVFVELHASNLRV